MASLLRAPVRPLLGQWESSSLLGLSLVWVLQDTPLYARPAQTSTTFFSSRRGPSMVSFPSLLPATSCHPSLPRVVVLFSPPSCTPLQPCVSVPRESRGSTPLMLVFLRTAAHAAPLLLAKMVCPLPRSTIPLLEHSVLPSLANCSLRRNGF